LGPFFIIKNPFVFVTPPIFLLSQCENLPKKHNAGLAEWRILKAIKKTKQLG
jgi:hypothetical protein